MGKNWGDIKKIGDVVARSTTEGGPMLKEYPANDLLGVIKRMAYLEGVISALEGSKTSLHRLGRFCRLERLPEFEEPADGVARAQDEFWRRNSGKNVLTFPSVGIASDDFVIQYAASIATDIWNKAQDAALFFAHEQLEECRSRLKQVRETLLSDTALREIILKDDAHAKT